MYKSAVTPFTINKKPDRLQGRISVFTKPGWCLDASFLNISPCENMARLPLEVAAGIAGSNILAVPFKVHCGQWVWKTVLSLRMAL